MKNAIGALALAGLFAAPPAMAGVVVVLNSGDATISLIDQDTRTEIKRYPVGKEPHHLMATPDGKSLIVANSMSNDLMFLDPKTGEVKRRLRDIPDPYQIGYSPDRKWFVVAGNRLNRVDIYAANGEDLKLVKAVPQSKTPSHIAFSADSQNAFVTLQDSDEVVAIRLADQSPLWKMKIGAMPAGIWMTPDDKHLLVGMTGADYVDVIDWRAQKSVKRIPPRRVRTTSAARRRAAPAGVEPRREFDQRDRPGHAREEVRHPGAGRSGLHGSDRRRQVHLGHAALDQAGRGGRHRPAQGGRDDSRRPLAARHLLRQQRALEIGATR